MKKLQEAQNQLSKTEKALSKFFHNEVVEVISTISANTFARPLALLYGGLFAFFVSILAMATYQYLGYTYNYLIPVSGFGIGYIVGLAIELLRIKRD